MSLETVAVKSLKNGATPVVGYREDLAIADVMTVSLFDTDISQAPVVSSYLWQLVGRPEGSIAGGAGPEPVSLGTGATASFTVDSDAGFAKDEPYKVRCTVNAGGPSVRQYEAILVRLNAATLADGRTLRMLGGLEDLTDDTSVAGVQQGWKTMLNRWFRKVLEGGGGGGAGSLTAICKDDEVSLTQATSGIVAESVMDLTNFIGVPLNAKVGCIARSQNAVPANFEMGVFVGSSAPGVIDGTLITDTGPLSIGAHVFPDGEVITDGGSGLTLPASSLVQVFVACLVPAEIVFVRGLTVRFFV